MRRWWWLAALLAACGAPDRNDLAGSTITNTPTTIDVDVETTDLDHDLRAVAPDGTLYATAHVSGAGALYLSPDAGETWEKRASFGSRSLRQMAVLADGTLLADVWDGASHTVYRSTDRARTWHAVLDLGDRWILQPHSIAELGGETFLLEYQTDAKVTPIRLFSSADRGATWKVRHVFEGVRHGHGLCADPATGRLWAMLGDATGSLQASDDGGRSWDALLGFDGVAVDAVPGPSGLLFGRDALYFPARPAIVRLGGDGKDTELAPLPGPSYSIHAIPGGGYVLGVTREVSGDVYPHGTPSAYLFGSPDGRNWTQLIRLPQDDANRYARADVYWHLPDGRLALTFSNVLLGGRSASGFQLLRAIVR